MKRRAFITGSMCAATSGIALSSAPIQTEPFPPLRFGICSDVHHDIYYDAPKRLAAFVDDMEKKNADFIIQLGDFCRPEPGNRAFMNIWNRFPNLKLHVIGNHDPEKKFSREKVVEFWEARGSYYSTDFNGYHLVVLDGNDPNPTRKDSAQYDRYVSAEQLNWLENDVAKTGKPVIVFIHQSLDMDGGVENAARVRAVLDRCNRNAGFLKVQAVFSGHHHLDYYNVINGIHYIQINSMSYHWQGEQYGESPFDDELNRKYPHLKKMNHYKDSLWAFIEISEDGILKMTGQKSEFIGKSPQELGMPEFHRVHPVVPYISDRTIKLSYKLG